LNTRIYRCPGEQIRGREGNHNQRFLIESDVVLQQISTGEKDNADDIVVCKGLVLPKKAENTINNLLGISHCGCLDKNCRFRELCRHSGGNQDLEDGNPSSKTVSDKSIAPLAKLSLCADSYNVPGSIAHVLNNLLFSTTSLKEKEPDKLVDLTFAKSYYSLNEKMHLKEFFGNVVKIKEGKREEKFKETFISYISIYPIVGNDKWKNYREALEGFLTKECGFEAKADGVDGDSYKIKSESHTKICSGTCPLACRDKVCRT
jgi:hypothetical protein